MTYKIHPDILANEEALAILQLSVNFMQSNLHPIAVARMLSEEPYASMPDDKIAKVLKCRVTKLRNIRAILKLVPTVLEHIQIHKPSIGLDILVEIQKLPATKQMDMYKNYLDNNVNRNHIREVVRAYKRHKVLKTPELILQNNIDRSAVSDDVREDFEKELAVLLAKYKSPCGSKTI